MYDSQLGISSKAVLGSFWMKNKLIGFELNLASLAASVGWLR